jgi:2'-5' RNA ligase
MDRQWQQGQAARVNAAPPGDGATDAVDPQDEATLAVPFPELDELLRPFHPELDPGAGLGIPAHVTILHPFAAPSSLSPADVEWLRDLFAATPAFDCRFTRTRWFADHVLWLEPEPTADFRRLTARVAARFPEHPPYGGAYPGITPHLTLAKRDTDGDPASARESLDRLHRVERRIADLLPVTLPADRVALMQGGPDVTGWRSLLDFPFGREPA